MNLNVIVPDIIGDVVSKMALPAGIVSLNYLFGTNLQIISQLDKFDGSGATNKYPLFSLQLPIREKRGNVGYYGSIIIPRIVIGTLTNDEKTTKERYLAAGNFKTILYPLYYEFLNQLGISPWIVQQEPNSIVHDKVDRPEVKAVPTGSNDMMDSIEILNMELLINQLKTC